MSAPGTPEHLRDPKNWPPQMQDEWNNLHQVATRYHAELVEGFRKARAAIDAFRPDFVLLGRRPVRELQGRLPAAVWDLRESTRCTSRSLSSTRRWRCYDLGKQVAEIIQQSPWRAVVIGSSSWSHASLTGKNRFAWNDVEGDRKLLEQLKAGEQHKWRDLDPDAMRESGLHEFGNWICLAGAMEGRKAEVLAYCESYMFNSERVVGLFPN